ncbi:MAG: radical SAM protein [Syntrophomonadaceae bacterium]|nr:radical SAM protein [Syntrophomonadaceae bacterium]
MYANDRGELLDDPGLQMLGGSGGKWVTPDPAEMMPLPEGASLVTVPQQRAVGLDGYGKPKLVSNEEAAWTAAALLPQGFTRTLIPAGVEIEDYAGKLPLLGYTAIGFHDGQVYAAALQADEHRKWHPDNFNTEDLPLKIREFRKKYPGNQIYAQLERCATEYSCFTAQNIFYRRWEGGIPTTNVCNARCLGCISEDHIGVLLPQVRLSFHPELEEVCGVGVEHLTKAEDGIISFGQGCEGDPVLNAEFLSGAIRRIRAAAGAGTINMNTNAGHAEGVKKMCAAGLDSIRISIFSCLKHNYNKYHNPRGYDLKEVAESVKIAKEYGCFIALNLLTFPGFTDRESEIEALLTFVRKNPVDMIQFRNLNIDPSQLWRRIDISEEGIGIVNLVNVLETEAPHLRLGSYTPPVGQKI